MALIIGGFFNAGFGGLINAALVEIVSPKSYATAVGMQALAIGIGETVGPFIGGVVADSSLPADRLNMCDGMDWHNTSMIDESQKQVLNSDISSGLRLSDKEYLEYIESSDKTINWDSYCEKQYWQCFLVGSICMIMSAVCVAVMKWLYEKKRKFEQGGESNKV